MSRSRITDSNWQGSDARTMPELGPVINFQAIAGNEQVSLSWSDPEDVTNQFGTAIWRRTIIRRKVGLFPIDQYDGQDVLDSIHRDQYATTPFVDIGLTNSTTYYYTAFPIDDKGNTNYSTLNTARAIPHEAPPPIEKEEIFNSPDEYVFDPVAKGVVDGKASVMVVGGGGGGGDTPAAGYEWEVCGGGGGASGQIKTITDIPIGNNPVTIIVGDGGSGGQSGQNSSFGNYVSCLGGAQGFNGVYRGQNSPGGLGYGQGSVSGGKGGGYDSPYENAVKGEDNTIGNGIGGSGGNYGAFIFCGGGGGGGFLRSGTANNPKANDGQNNTSPPGLNGEGGKGGSGYGAGGGGAAGVMPHFNNPMSGCDYGAHAGGKGAVGMVSVKYKTYDDAPPEYHGEMIQFFGMRGKNGIVRLKLEMPLDCDSVVICRKSTPWAENETETSGTLIIDMPYTLDYSGTNQWYEVSGLSGNVPIYFKTFPRKGQGYSYSAKNECIAYQGNLEMEYTFDAIDLGVVEDTSNNGRSGTFWNERTIEGKIGIAMLSTPYNSNPPRININTPWKVNQSTVCFWLNITRNVDCVFLSSGNDAFRIARGVNGQQGYFVISSVSASPFWQESYTFSVDIPSFNEWYFIAFKLDFAVNRIADISINGGTFVRGGGTPLTWGRPEIQFATVGNYPTTGTSDFPFYIDQFRIYSALLTEDEIRVLYNQGKGC